MHVSLVHEYDYVWAFCESSLAITKINCMRHVLVVSPPKITVCLKITVYMKA